MVSTTYLLVPLLLASYASAHGFVNQITVNGETHKSARPSNQRSSQPASIRQVGSVEPVQGAKSPDMNCGKSPTFSASDSAKVQAGDTLEIDWRGGDLSNWPHRWGPVITYLADCGQQDCANFDSTKARWFKIEQQGFKPGGVKDEGGNFAWVQDFSHDGKPINVRIPPSLAPGNYLMRHEIIALHNGGSVGGAEFYPSCAQLSISGSGTSKPSPDELVSFPGAYDDRDKGIVFNVFGPLNPDDYVFPGPPVAKLAQDSSTGAGNGGGSSNTNNGNNGGQGGAAKSNKSKSCKLRKGASAKPAPEVRPRHISRIMRRLVGLSGSGH